MRRLTDIQKKMADTIAKTLNSCDFDVKEYDVAEINDEMITALHSADALVFGTPTIKQKCRKACMGYYFFD